MEKQKNREIGVYCYYDKEANCFDVPFHSMDDLNAVRKFKIDAEKEGTVISRFTKEFELFKLGSFDMHTGTFKLKKTLLVEGEKIALVKDK